MGTSALKRAPGWDIRTVTCYGVWGGRSGAGRLEERESEEPGHLEREAKKVPFDFVGKKNLLTNLTWGRSTHKMQDDWREQDPYPDRPAQWLLQEFRLKIGGQTRS